MILGQLILSGSVKQRQQTAWQMIGKIMGEKFANRKSHPDLILVEAENSLGIELVRNLQKQLSLKPYSAPLKIALIPQAEKLTLAAQNALLKTLEEPAANTMIILLAPKKEALLPTIVSRCQITQLTQSSQIETDPDTISRYKEILISVLQSNPGQRLKIAQQYSQPQNALALTENLLDLWRKFLRIKIGLNNSKHQKWLNEIGLSQIKSAIVNTEKIRSMIIANIHPQLAIDNLFLTYPKI